MSLSFVALKPLAILLAAVAGFMVGGVWYGAIFGQTWPRLHGYQGERLAAMAKTQGLAFGLMFLGDIIMAIGLAILVGTLGIKSALSGAQLGALLWAGIGLAETVMQNAAHRKPLPAFAIDAVHQLLYLVVAGAILGAMA